MLLSINQLANRYFLSGITFTIHFWRALPSQTKSGFICLCRHFSSVSSPRHPLPRQITSPQATKGLILQTTKIIKVLKKITFLLMITYLKGLFPLPTVNLYKVLANLSGSVCLSGHFVSTWWIA